MTWLALGVLALSLAGCSAKDAAVDGAIAFSNVERKVDISTNLVKIQSTVTVENTGTGVVSSILYAIDSEAATTLAYLGATKDGDDGQLKVSEAKVNVGEKGVQFYLIDLPTALGAGKSTVVVVKAVHTHRLVPHPASIQQNQKQLVLFNDNLFLYTPYQVRKQKTTVVLASGNVESYTKTKPNLKADNTITYGPFENKGPFEKSELSVHYENNKPFLSVTSMTRLIEVSHWGNVAVEEAYELQHTGAKLQGPFSRYDFQRTHDHLSAVESFKMVMPASARDVYYRDEIGNISTSHLRELRDAVELEVRPRFPLYGGWKTNYVIGYNIPSYQYLYNSGNNYALKMPFIDHIFDDQVVDELKVKIILPEGSQVSDVKTPFATKRSADELHFTYLDTAGRPVVQLYKNNLVEEHIQDFELKYTFQRLFLLREPALMIAVFYCFFLLVIVYVRLDFSIAKDDAAESSLKAASYIEQVQTLLDKRSALYQSYDDAVNKFKASKDLGALANQRKKIDADHKQLSQQIADIQTTVKPLSPEAADKLSELQKLDGLVKEHLNNSVSFAQKLVGGSMGKQQYLSAEEELSAKKKDLLFKIDSIVASL